MESMAKKKIDLKTLQETPPWEWPEDADTILLGLLRNEQADPSERLVAAELAGDYVVINDELADLLLTIGRNRHESEELRGEALLSLGTALEHADMMGFEDDDDILVSEPTFHKIQETLRKLYMDADTPLTVRRQVLEASVKAPQPWHQAAVRSAYVSDDEIWRLTAVFAMRFISGFDDQIIESMASQNPEIQYHAVCAAGSWQLDAAWAKVVALVSSDQTDKELLLAAIEAVGSIRPQEAPVVLGRLMDSDDEDVVETVHETLAMAEEPLGDERNGWTH
jgi:hypothetical protein